MIRRVRGDVSVFAERAEWDDGTVGGRTDAGAGAAAGLDPDA